MTSVTRVLMRKTYDGEPQPLATFRFDGMHVTAEWHDEAYRDEVETHGLAMMVDGEMRNLRPSDGEPFVHGLAKIYSQSTLMVVRREVVP